MRLEGGWASAVAGDGTVLLEKLEEEEEEDLETEEDADPSDDLGLESEDDAGFPRPDPISRTQPAAAQDEAVDSGSEYSYETESQY
eukprot:COSAG01_NODE_42803_length_436_cov_1.080119_2_plen_85_part_01